MFSNLCVCVCVCVTNMLPFLRTAKSCVFVKDLFGILLSDLHQLTAREGVLLAVAANKAVTVAGLHSEFVTFYICSCVLLLLSLLKVREVFIARQRQHQLTWQADLKDGEGGARVHSCTHHSAVQPDL